MGPPSDNLEFFESIHFKKKLAAVPRLREAVLAHLRSRPNDGVEFARGVRELHLQWDGFKVAVIHRRTGNRIGLIQVFELPEGEKRLALNKQDLLTLYGPKD